MNDTISAISTPRGEGGIGIVRLSGPDSLSIIEKIFRPHRPRSEPYKFRTHTLTYGYIVDPETGEQIDEALVSVMLAPKTYTKEDIVEINCHGGSIPLSKTLELTLHMGARLAEPGEFTKRAFLNGRIDLAQAEAVADIVRAKTDLCLKIAVNQLQGRLSREINQIRNTLIDLLAEVEAGIDFPDEDLDFLTSEEITGRIEIILDRLNSLLITADSGRIITEGLKGVIVGRPNVGKSSLFNALLREDRAIVTSIPGTTRDPIEEFVNLDGVPLKLTDTAGIHKADNIVEIESVERTKMWLSQADLILAVLDASEKLTDDDKEILSLVEDKKTVIVVNKIDLTQALNTEDVQAIAKGKPTVRVSALKEEGLNDLKLTIRNLIFNDGSVPTDAILVTKVRHKNAIRNAVESLQYALESSRTGMEAELIAVDLRGALKALGEIVGETTSEEILNNIFSRFCIGK